MSAENIYSKVIFTVKVAMTVRCIAQYTTPCSTAQHICALQHNATTGITHIPSVVPITIGGQLEKLGITCTVWSEAALLGLNNYCDSFKVRLDLTIGFGGWFCMFVACALG